MAFRAKRKGAMRSYRLGVLAFTAIYLACGVPAGPVFAQAEGAEPPKARITKKDCNRVIRHVARADVNYTPGVDVRGNPVAPADATGGFTIPLPDVYEFNVTKDLSAYLGGAEEQLAAEQAAAIAADKANAATDAAVDSAELSLAGAQSEYNDAAADATAAEAAATAAQTAADAAPTDQALKAAAESAQADATDAQTALATAESGLATTQSAYNSAVAAAETGDAATALAGANTALTAAQAIGYTQDATASAASTAATSAASAYNSANAAALEAAETVAKSEGMTLNVGTVRFNINTGAMTFNGKPINDAAMSDLAERCRVMMSSQPR